MSSVKFIERLKGLRRKMKEDMVTSANNFDTEDCKQMRKAIYLSEISLIRNILNNDSEGIPTEDRVRFTILLDELQKKIIEGSDEECNSSAYLNHLYNLSQYVKEEVNKQYILNMANNIKPEIKKEKISARKVKPKKDLNRVLDTLYTVKDEIFKDMESKTDIQIAVDIVDQIRLSYILNNETKGIDEADLRNFNILISDMCTSYIQTGTTIKYREEYYDYLTRFKNNIVSNEGKKAIQTEINLIYRLLPRKRTKKANESLEYLVLKRSNNGDKYIVDQEQFIDKTRYDYVLIDSEFNNIKQLSKIANMPVEINEYIALLDKETDELSIYKRTSMATAYKVESCLLNIDKIREDMKKEK